MSNAFETIRVDKDQRGVARLILDRPEKHNALNSMMIRELKQAAEQLGADPSVRVVILSAAGKSFCAGGDLNWMKEQAAKNRVGRIDEADHLAAMLQALDEIPKLMIAVVEGPAYGGGVGLLCVCDIVLADASCKFALTETRLGLIPATIAPFLIRRIGLTNARRFALNAAAFGADEAKSIALVSEIHASDELAAAGGRQTALALACAPGAIADAKRLFGQIAAGAITQAGTVEALADRWESAEARAGVDAFFTHRRPLWAS
jgi:methylglutaconyl-CoA hydratase